MIIEKSNKEILLNEKILSLLSGKPKTLASLLINDEEVRTLQEYANIVSIKRLGFNDHGPVHMRQTTLNALQIVSLLTTAGVKFSLQQEETGDTEDSLCAILLACFLHDSGMTLTRGQHEQTGLLLTLPIINRLLQQVYGQNNQLFVVRSLALEGILGHMAITPIYSLEAGIILIADGCDMQKGRARIPLSIMKNEGHEGRIGDIHKYSADAIEHIAIIKGDKKPIKIVIEMSSSIGFFQVEEVLLPKINKSPIKPYIELVGQFDEGKDYKQYF